MNLFQPYSLLTQHTSQFVFFSAIKLRISIFNVLQDIGCEVSKKLNKTTENSSKCKAILIGPRREKTCLQGFVNNKGADQPAHPRSLISAFVIHFLQSTICKLASSEFSIF